VASELRGGDEGGVGEAFGGTKPLASTVGVEAPTTGEGLGDCCDMAVEGEISE
jgi:hypothetical protein